MRFMAICMADECETQEARQLFIQKAAEDCRGPRRFATRLEAGVFEAFENESADGSAPFHPREPCRNSRSKTKAPTNISQ